MQGRLKSQTREIQVCPSQSPAPRKLRCRNQANTEYVHAWCSPTRAGWQFTVTGEQVVPTESVGATLEE